MANVDGAWDCVIKSPLGDQKAVLTVNSTGGSFVGNMTGAMGAMDVEDGKVDGDTLSWKMNLKVPMPMTLDCTARIDGDSITGSAGAGAFGSFPLTGTRQA
ncbi:hypothetical protein [Sphingomonas cavernae]|uniref:Uncharacterized protein n=1 Tax=Sphingomonas cavernae TaxID=2320861 RepID=A0A418WQ62_9SPHN|nr:hypothetical protein [Sphingomonas cavernae]RJF93351.1 hypothetical protein D3876_03115 [Sphingomonas cavernae]